MHRPRIVLPKDLTPVTSIPYKAYTEFVAPAGKPCGRDCFQPRKWRWVYRMNRGRGGAWPPFLLENRDE